MFQHNVGKSIEDLRRGNMLVLEILTHNKATVGTDHVPGSVVLHQDGLWVVGAVHSWKASRSISTARHSDGVGSINMQGGNQDKVKTVELKKCMLFIRNEALKHDARRF